MAKRNPSKSKTEPAAHDVAIEELQQQLETLSEALQRERADATNVRRRAEEEKLSMAGYYKALIMRQLLPVVDNFERALRHVPAELEGNDYIKGVQGIVKQFEKVLTDLGVEKIKTVGEPFDPKIHEAISMEEGDGTKEVVSEELQAGYRLGDDVLRHAMVKVKMQ